MSSARCCRAGGSCGHCGGGSPPRVPRDDGGGHHPAGDHPRRWLTGVGGYAVGQATFVAWEVESRWRAVVRLTPSLEQPPPPLCPWGESPLVKARALLHPPRGCSRALSRLGHPPPLSLLRPRPPPSAPPASPNAPRCPFSSPSSPICLAFPAHYGVCRPGRHRLARSGPGTAAPARTPPRASRHGLPM